MRGDERKIIGISIARKYPRGRQVVLDSIKDYLAQKCCNVSDDAMEASTIFVDDYTGDGYGKENETITNMITQMLKEYGIPMDSTYTAKAYTGMMTIIDKANIKNKNILFIHTGGTPLFFDDLERMK